ncbi:putative Protein of unknown function (DUF789) [Trypanosoma vivax]|nr:putative Protein of unknown function (DUF789) [Trypanosoma vivax]
MDEGYETGGQLQDGGDMTAYGGGSGAKKPPPAKGCKTCRQGGASRQHECQESLKCNPKSEGGARTSLESRGTGGDEHECVGKRSKASGDGKSKAARGCGGCQLGEGGTAGHDSTGTGRRGPAPPYRSKTSKSGGTATSEADGGVRGVVGRSGESEETQCLSDARDAEGITNVCGHSSQQRSCSGEGDEIHGADSTGAGVPKDPDSCCRVAVAPERSPVPVGLQNENRDERGDSFPAQMPPHGDGCPLFVQSPSVGLSPVRRVHASELHGPYHTHQCNQRTAPAQSRPPPRGGMWLSQSQQHQFNMGPSSVSSGCYSAADSSAMGEQTDLTLPVAVCGHESGNGFAGGYAWKSSTSIQQSQQQHLLPNSSPQLAPGPGIELQMNSAPVAGSAFGYRSSTLYPCAPRHDAHRTPLYEHYAAQDILFDEADLDHPFDAAIYGNIVPFVEAVSPKVMAHQFTELCSVEDAVPHDEGPANASNSPAALPASPAEPMIFLSNIWKALDMPFACVIPLASPVSLAPMRLLRDSVVYNPFLSGFRLGFVESSQSYMRLRAMRRGTSNATATSASPNPVESSATHSTLTTEAVTCEESAKQLNAHHCDPSATSVSTAIRSVATSPGSLAEVCDDATVECVTWGAADRPDQRSLVLEQVRDLASQDPRYSVLLSANTSELDHRSWFAVLWRPVFDQSHSAKHSCGSFIVYYALRPPRHRYATQPLPTALERMNSSWMSPVFRCDRVALEWDMWGLSQQETAVGNGVMQSHILLSTDCDPSSAGPLPSAACKGSKESSSCTAARVEDPFLAQRGTELRPRRSDAAATCATPVSSVVSQDTKDINSSLSRTDSTVAGAPPGPYVPLHDSPGETASPLLTRMHQASGPFLVRIPVVGVIPIRCRADVWFMQCSSGGAPEPRFGGDVTNSQATVRRYYRAPLFLVTAALQLMSWNAVEEFGRQRARRKVTTGGGTDSVQVESGNVEELDGVFPSRNAVPTSTASLATKVSDISSSSRAAYDGRLGVRLLFEGAKAYRQYREGAHMDTLATNTLQQQQTEHPEGGGRVQQPISPCHSSNNPVVSEACAVVRGLPDFYQCAQFDNSLLKYAERYA